MYNTCLKYCAVVNRMLNPRNSGRIDELNDERMAVHAELCREYRLSRERTLPFTDSLPDTVVETQAETLHRQLSMPLLRGSALLAAMQARTHGGCLSDNGGNNSVSVDVCGIPATMYDDDGEWYLAVAATGLRDALGLTPGEEDTVGFEDIYLTRGNGSRSRGRWFNDEEDFAIGRAAVADISGKLRSRGFVVGDLRQDPRLPADVELDDRMRGKLANAYHKLAYKAGGHYRQQTIGAVLECGCWNPCIRRPWTRFDGFIGDEPLPCE